MIKRYTEWKKNLNVKKITSDIIKFTQREAKETKISAKILSKIISNYFKLSNHKISDNEIQFLKDHTTDLAKILAIIASWPTPIPYMEIAFILKKFGINLFPNDRDLEIPPEHKD